jgi:hypothetical protein
MLPKAFTAVRELVFFHLNPSAAAEVHGMCHIFEAAEMLICSGCDSLQRRLEITELHIK